jgi:hypothetical protein
MESRPKEESDRESQGVEEKSDLQASDHGSAPSTHNPEEEVGTTTEAGKPPAPAVGSDEDYGEYDPADRGSLEQVYQQPSSSPSPRPRPMPPLLFPDLDPYGSRFGKLLPPNSTGTGRDQETREEAWAKSNLIDKVEHTESGPGTREPITLYNLPDQHFKGPKKGRGPYASVSILDPVITVERHYGKYYIAARFNIETTMLGYDQRERFE